MQREFIPPGSLNDSPAHAPRTQTLTLALVIVTAALHLWFLTQDEHVSFRVALRHGAGSAVAFAMGVVLVWPVAALFSYHVRVSGQAGPSGAVRCGS